MQGDLPMESEPIGQAPAQCERASARRGFEAPFDFPGPAVIVRIGKDTEPALIGIFALAGIDAAQEIAVLAAVDHADDAPAEFRGYVNAPRVVLQSDDAVGLHARGEIFLVEVQIASFVQAGNAESAHGGEEGAEAGFQGGQICRGVSVPTHGKFAGSEKVEVVYGKTRFADAAPDSFVFGGGFGFAEELVRAAREGGGIVRHGVDPDVHALARLLLEQVVVGAKGFGGPPVYAFEEFLYCAVHIGLGIPEEARHDIGAQLGVFPSATRRIRAL